MSGVRSGLRPASNAGNKVPELPGPTQQIAPRVPIPWLDNRRSLRQRQTRRKAATQSHGPTSDPGYGRRAAEGTKPVGVCSPHPLRSEGFPMPLRLQYGEIDVGRYANGACAGHGGIAQPFGWHGAAAVLTITSTLRGSLSASTGEVGRSHVTPTPDPDPRDSGPRTRVCTASTRSCAAHRGRRDLFRRSCVAAGPS